MRCLRLHQKQIVDFTPGRGLYMPGRALKGSAPRGCRAQPLGVGLRRLMDQVVEYFKPVRRPKWMSEDEYRVLPESIMVRELRYRITKRREFRTARGGAGNDALGCRGVPG